MNFYSHFKTVITQIIVSPISKVSTFIIISIVSLYAPIINAQGTNSKTNKPKYTSSEQPMQLFDSKGKKITYKQWINTLKKELDPAVPTVILFGELHDNPLVHFGGRNV